MGRFPEKVFQHGEPDLRPEQGHIILSHTRGMAALEERYRGRALVAMVDFSCPLLSSESMLATLEAQCGVQPGLCRMEVCFPHDFFIHFSSEEDCTRVLHQSRVLCCCGATVSLCRWTVTLFAWMKDPCAIPKRVKVEILEPLPPPRVLSSDS